jgi:hypothetical protein
MNRVVHFEIHAGNPQRLIDFYGRLFGWKFAPYGPSDFYWLITTGDDATPGINGGMVRRTGATPDVNASTPVIAFVGTIEVADIDMTGVAIEGQGGTAALPKNAIPGIGWAAYYKDPDSNIFGIFQADKAAKEGRHDADRHPDACAFSDDGRRQTLQVAEERRRQREVRRRHRRDRDRQGDDGSRSRRRGHARRDRRAGRHREREGQRADRAVVR